MARNMGKIKEKEGKGKERNEREDRKRSKDRARNGKNTLHNFFFKLWLYVLKISAIKIIKILKFLIEIG